MFIRDFIGFESDPAFGQDVHNASADIALEGLPQVIEAAFNNAMNPKHPKQAEWMLFYLQIVQYPIADGIDVAKLVLPDDQKTVGKRISRKG